MTVGAAVIGLGVGEQHARAFVRDPRCRLKWVHDLDPARAIRVAAEVGGSAAASFEAVLADPEVHVVAIATYDDQHAAQVIAALHAGKHVFCEKPLCLTGDELSAIRRALGDRHLGCNLVLRAAALYGWLRRAIRAGELGDIYAVDGDYLYGRIHKITEGWRGEIDGYSVFEGGAVHMLDLLLWLTGERPSAVAAVGNKIATRGTKFRYRDFVAATYQFPSGLVGRITANFGCVHRHHHVLRVFGTKATFMYDDAGARIHRSREAAGEPVAENPLPASKGDLIPSFIDRVIGGGDSQDTRHEFDLMAACIAADRAVDTAQTQTIEYPT